MYQTFDELDNILISAVPRSYSYTIAGGREQWMSPTVISYRDARDDNTIAIFPADVYLKMHPPEGRISD
jgi:hypothetical protein